MGTARQGRVDDSFIERAGFTPKQWEAYQATFLYRYILYGGARGGGKSRFVRWWLADYLVMQFKKHGIRNCRVGLFCETYPDLRDRQISKIKEEFPLWLGEIKDTQADGLGFFMREEFGSGVMALRNLDDPSKYQSAEFAAIAVDELTKVTKQTFDILRGSLRWPGINHTVLFGATNPGGIGHLWVKQLWIDKQFPPEMQNIKDQFVFIRSLPSDNPMLSQSYWDELNSLPDDLRRAWVDGDWNVFSGQAFASWRSDRHVVEPFTIPDWWLHWRAVDWGYSNPFCCLWLAKDPDTGRIYVYRELYKTDLTDHQQARAIRDLTLPGEQIALTYADPSMWARKTTGEVATSTADEYASEGVPIVRADNDRLSGKRKVDRLLSPLPDGQPGLLVFRTCANLVRTLPALPYDATNVEDIDTKSEDHAYDALRYGLTNAQIKAVQINTQQQRSPLAGMRML